MTPLKRRSSKNTDKTVAVPANPAFSSSVTPLLVAILLTAALFGAVGFLVGHSANQPMHGLIDGRGRSDRFGRLGAFGDVTAVNSSSVSVKNERNGTTKTYSLNSATKITKNGVAAKASDIVVGDRVLIESSRSNSTIAARVIISPPDPDGDNQNPTSAT